jgi:hypothetical protein
MDLISNIVDGYRVKEQHSIDVNVVDDFDYKKSRARPAGAGVKRSGQRKLGNYSLD